MRIAQVVIVIPLLAAPTLFAQDAKTYVGVITDTMCARDHSAMKMTSNEKCVRECVGDGKTYKYALAHANGVYTLSDQQSPAQLAGVRVKVTGVLYAKTNILKVDRIERVN